MSRVPRLLLALVVATLCGCPFSSDKPLSDPAAGAPDSRLFGTWKAQDPETGEWSSLTILAFNTREMVGFTHDKDPDKIDAFRLLPTTIGVEKFLSIKGLGGTDEGWYYARYEVAQENLRLKIVDDGLFGDRRFSTSRQLVDFIRQHLADPLLYTPAGDTPTEMVLERAAAPGS